MKQLGVLAIIGAVIFGGLWYFGYLDETIPGEDFDRHEDEFRVRISWHERVGNEAILRPIQNASVTIRELGMTDRTNSSGNAYFADVPPAEYNFDIAALGFESKTIEFTVTETTSNVSTTLTKD